DFQRQPEELSDGDSIAVLTYENPRFATIVTRGWDRGTRYPDIIGVRASAGRAACSIIHQATSAREMAAVTPNARTIFTRRVSGPFVRRVGRGQQQSSPDSA